MTISTSTANRLGFLVLGLTNNFAYVIMLSAAYDLLKQTDSTTTTTNSNSNSNNDQATSVTNVTQSNTTQKYCNEQSTSTILLADTIPSLTVKLVYPFLFVNLPTGAKALATALFSAASFLVTGFVTNQVLIFMGVAFASFSSGLGESTYLSNTPLYGDVSLSGWSMGTGAAGLLGAGAYALLKIVLSIKYIMIIMLVVPVAMVVAYFKIIIPIDDSCETSPTNSEATDGKSDNGSRDDQSTQIGKDLGRTRQYGSQRVYYVNRPTSSSEGIIVSDNDSFDLREKFHYLPRLSKYFLPLLLVYFAEYFINQGLFELIYFPEISVFDHAAQYRWFQVSYQFGVLVSRSSLDLFRLKRLWTMSLLQTVNAVLFLAHTSKLIHIPSFYIVIAIIVYEGLLGGFTYANTFYRIKKELPPGKQEFGISTVTIADTLGIVMAGLVSLPVHNALFLMLASVGAPPETSTKEQIREFVPKFTCMAQVRVP